MTRHNVKARFNYTAGPACLPEPVLHECQQALIDWQGRGVSVLSVGHRTEPFMQMAFEAEQDLRDLLEVPDHYHVLFLSGGATLHFSMLAQNLLLDQQQAWYLNTGHWSEKALVHAQRLGSATCYAQGEAAFQLKSIECDEKIAYVHLASNETINGWQWPHFPHVTNGFLVADMSSDILSYPFDVNQFGLIYMGAQKNIGPSGFSIAFVRNDVPLADGVHLPPLASYKAHIDQRSMINTPNTFAWYLCGRVAKWLKQEGGVSEMARRSQARSSLFYHYLDQTDFYYSNVPALYRSKMSVPFFIRDETLHTVFANEAEAAGLIGLAGHRSVGGLRACFYNAMPIEGVQALIDFMKDFEQRYG